MTVWLHIEARSKFHFCNLKSFWFGHARQICMALLRDRSILLRFFNFMCIITWKKSDSFLWRYSKAKLKPRLVVFSRALLLVNSLRKLGISPRVRLFRPSEFRLWHKLELYFKIWMWENPLKVFFPISVHLAVWSSLFHVTVPLILVQELTANLLSWRQSSPASRTGKYYICMYDTLYM